MTTQMIEMRKLHDALYRVATAFESTGYAFAALAERIDPERLRNLGAAER